MYKMNKEREKFAFFQLREQSIVENDDFYTVKGYAATWDYEYPVFDYIEEFGYVEFMESFQRGAFTKSINQKLIK